MKSFLTLSLFLAVLFSTNQVIGQTQQKSSTIESAVKEDNSVETKAADHNSTRSNKSGVAPDKPVINSNEGSTSKKGYDYYQAKSDMNSTQSKSKAQDHNSTRSNKTASKIDSGNSTDDGTSNKIGVDEKTNKSEAARSKKK